MSDRVVVQLDLYPARLFVQSTSYLAVRVVITDTDIQAWRLGPSGPEISWERDLTGSPTGKVSTGINVPTSAGDVWVEGDGGCACGSALRNADLFGGAQEVVTGVLQ